MPVLSKVKVSWVPVMLNLLYRRRRGGIVGKESGEGFLARAGCGAERPDDVHGQAAGRVAGDRGGYR